MISEGVTSTAARGIDPEKRPWEVMALTKVGRLGDLMQGSGGTKGDGGTQTMA